MDHVLLMRLAALSIALAPGLARATILYNSSLGSTPRLQGWSYSFDPRPGNATTGVSKGLLSLDTSAVKVDKAGYLRTWPFDNSGSYTVEIDARLLSESHTPSDRNNDGVDDRAGFSLIVLGDDSRGIEIGFWTDRVWAQADQPLFVQAEHASFDTTLTVTAYVLAVAKGRYSLSANGAPLLEGPLRDYSSFGLPYTIPNFVFFGDDTTSASANVQVAKVEVNVLPAPEPESIVLFVAGALALFAFKSNCRGIRRRAPRAAGEFPRDTSRPSR